MNKHTSGKWICKGPAEGADESRCGDYAIIDAKGKIIAEAFRMVDENEYRDAQANANLMVAAPELLEALLSITYLVYPADSLKMAQTIAKKALEDGDE